MKPLEAVLKAYALAATLYTPTIFAYPQLVEALGGSEPHVGLGYAAYYLATIITRPVAGKLVDSAGRAPATRLGLAILALSAATLAASQSPVHAVAAMAAMGIGAGLVNVAALTYAADLGGLEQPEVFARLKAAAVKGALAGAATIPLGLAVQAYAGELVAARAAFAAPAAAQLLALRLGLPETKHLAARHEPARSRLVPAAIPSLLLGASVGMYGPMAIPLAMDRLGVSGLEASALYITAVPAWLVGARLAAPSMGRISAGLALVSLGALAIYASHTPLEFSAAVFAESLGLAVAETSIDAVVARIVKGSEWGRAYGVVNSAYGAAYAVASAASGLAYPQNFIVAAAMAAASATAIRLRGVSAPLGYREARHNG